MKLKALLVALFIAGLAASLALAQPVKHPKPGATTTGTTTTTTPKPKCHQVELKGTATGGSVAFTVTKASKSGRSLVGTAVSLSVPAGAKVKAKACTTEGSNTLTLRDLHVEVSPAHR
jgi:predicted secreted protein